MISMVFDRGFEDPAVRLWMVMLGVQSLPYAATFVTAPSARFQTRSSVWPPWFRSLCCLKPLNFVSPFARSRARYGHLPHRRASRARGRRVWTRRTR